MIKELIERLGVSRRVLATFLQTDQGNLSKYENATRNIPFAAISQVAKLQAMIHNSPVAGVPQPTVEQRLGANERAEWCRALLKHQHQKLLIEQRRFRQAHLMLSVLSQYNQTEEIKEPKTERWVTEQHYVASIKIIENGWQAQQEILLKMKLLEVEALFWEASLLSFHQ